jgi:hypothetical protein
MEPQYDQAMWNPVPTPRLSLLRNAYEESR